jgi:hypothetical protein
MVPGGRFVRRLFNEIDKGSNRLDGLFKHQSKRRGRAVRFWESVIPELNRRRGDEDFDARD